MAPHGHGEDNPLHGDKPTLDLAFDPAEREGLTTEQAEEAYKKWGFNELPTIEIPLWWVFLEQYMGTMPYMLELAIIIAGAVQDWIDFGIIIAMVRQCTDHETVCHFTFPLLLYFSLCATALLDSLKS